VGRTWIYIRESSESSECAGHVFPGVFLLLGRNEDSDTMCTTRREAMFRDRDCRRRGDVSRMKMAEGRDRYQEGAMSSRNVCFEYRHMREETRT